MFFAQYTYKSEVLLFPPMVKGLPWQ